MRWSTNYRFRERSIDMLSNTWFSRSNFIHNISPKSEHIAATFFFCLFWFIEEKYISKKKPSSPDTFITIIYQYALKKHFQI